MTQAFKEEVQAGDRWVSNSLSKPVLFHTSFTLGASGCPPQVTQGPQQLHAHTQANWQPSPSALGACPKGCSFLYSIKPSKFVKSQGHVLSDPLISGDPLSQGGPHTGSGTELTRYCGDRKETGQSWQSLPAAVELMQRQGWPSFADGGGGQLQGWLAYGL